MRVILPGEARSASIYLEGARVPHIAGSERYRAVGLRARCIPQVRALLSASKWHTRHLPPFGDWDPNPGPLPTARVIPGVGQLSRTRMDARTASPRFARATSDKQRNHVPERIRQD